MTAEEKIVPKKAKKRRVTWTFQPDEHVVEEVVKLNGGKKLSRGQRTELIKRALSYQYPEAFIAVAKKRLADATEEVAELERRLAPKGDLPNSCEEQEMVDLVKREEADLEGRGKKR